MGATTAVVDGDIPLLPPSSRNPPAGVSLDNSVGSNVSVSSEAAIATVPYKPPPSSQDSSKTVDTDVSESFESEAAMSDSAKSKCLLQHLQPFFN